MPSPYFVLIFPKRLQKNTSKLVRFRSLTVGNQSLPPLKCSLGLHSRKLKGCLPEKRELVFTSSNTTPIDPKFTLIGRCHWALYIFFNAVPNAPQSCVCIAVVSHKSASFQLMNHYSMPHTQKYELLHPSYDLAMAERRNMREQVFKHGWRPTV